MLEITYVGIKIKVGDSTDKTFYGMDKNGLYSVCIFYLCLEFNCFVGQVCCLWQSLTSVTA